MATDRSHLSLNLTSTLAPAPQQQPLAPPPQVQQHTTTSEHSTDNQENPSASVKRGPGRPKGSTKKSLEAESTPPKLKRPVGRPRKDGRPAGSVPKVIRGPGRPRKNFQLDFAVNTFSHSQQLNGEQQEWSQMPGMFNNYRLKGAGSDPTVPDSSGDKAGSSSATTDTNGHSLSNSKWYQSASTASTSNGPAASSSSIANALNPHSMSQGGVNNFSEHLVGASALGLLDKREQRGGNASDINPGTNGIEERPLSIPQAQIPEIILSTIYSLFSRPSTSDNLPLPRDVLSAYRSHLGNLSISHAMAYTALKTFWLPYSPLLFRLVLPRTNPSSKSVHRSTSTSQKPSSSSLNSNFASHPSQPTANGDTHSNNRTPLSGEQNYGPHRFFYWDPFYLSLSGPLNCPVCQQAPLTHNGPIRSGPLRVFDLPSGCAPSASAHANVGLVPAAFYVIGMQYGCSQRTCGTKFNSWDPRIINNLPQVLADEWPVHLSSVTESEQSDKTDKRGARWSGDAVSRPLFTLTKTLFQAGTSRPGVRDFLAKLWNWNDSEREEEHEDEATPEDVVDNATSSNDQEKVAVVEALFASPYSRLWTAPTAQSHDADTSNSSMGNGQRPAKRQKTSDVPQNLPPMVAATAPGYLSRPYMPQNSASGENAPNGIGLHITDHRHINGSSVDNHRSPRMLSQAPAQSQQSTSLAQPQPQPQTQTQTQSRSQPQPPQPQPQPQSQSQSHSQSHLRHQPSQPSQPQLKPNPSARPPQPSPRTTLTHARQAHIHTPSPIYPSTSLPNSTTNSPQTGSGTQLGLKRPLEPESHHPSNLNGPSVPPAPAPAPPQTSPGQPHFPGIAHSSPYSQLPPLQQQHPPPHGVQQHQQASLATHHPSSAPTRPGHSLHMHHPSLSLGTNGLARYGQPTLQSHQQPLLGSAPHVPPIHPATSHPPHAPPVPPAPQTQRRVRHCVKCGRHDCKGKGGSQFCRNHCKDCGSMDCRGRNSKRPNASCRDGW